MIKYKNTWVVKSHKNINSFKHIFKSLILPEIKGIQVKNTHDKKIKKKILMIYHFYVGEDVGKHSNILLVIV